MLCWQVIRKVGRAAYARLDRAELESYANRARRGSALQSECDEDEGSGGDEGSSLSDTEEAEPAEEPGACCRASYAHYERNGIAEAEAEVLVEGLQLALVGCTADFVLSDWLSRQHMRWRQSKV